MAQADIYSFVLKKSREPDKLTVVSHEVEWLSCKELLKELVIQRVKYVLELPPETNIHSIWTEYFDFKKDDVFEKVRYACLARPRDILFFFGKMFEAACNRSHEKVNEDDFNYALDNYTNFLYQNLIAEMNAEYPYIRDMISELHSRFNDKIELNKFRDLIRKYESDLNNIDKLIAELFSNNYLIATCDDIDETYLEFKFVQELEKSLSENHHWWNFKKKIYMLCNIQDMHV